MLFFVYTPYYIVPVEKNTNAIERYTAVVDERIVAPHLGVHMHFIAFCGQAVTHGVLPLSGLHG